MPSTKERIIANAQTLFSRQGIANTRLQHIADETGISVGNLAYHFSTKEEIVQTVYYHALEELSHILIVPAPLPGLKSFDNTFSEMFQFMEKNVFYFTNFWEIKRNYPLLNEKIININKKVVSRLRRRIVQNAEINLWQKEDHKAMYYLLSQIILISFNTWISQQLLNDKPLKESIFKTYLWSLLYPHFTQEGKHQFKSLKIF